jgi:hypothetical protein
MMAEPNTPRNRGDKDAPHVSPSTPAEDLRTVAINQISWSAVFAGVAVALIAQLLLNMLGLGIGMATLDPGTADNPSASTFSIGAAVWWTVSGIVAAFLGGWIAGRTAGKPKESTGGWHGLVSWAVTSLIVIYLVTSAASSVIGGAMGALGGAMKTAGSTAASAAGPAAARPGALSSVMQQVQSTTGVQHPDALAATAAAAGRVMVSNDPQQAAQAREQAAQTLATERGISLPEARQQVAQQQQQATQTTKQVKQQVTEAADTATKAVSATALLAAISLLLGALAGWFGGRRGAPHPTLTAELPR